MEEITPELVRCKCGKEIRLDRKFRDKNLTTHGELSSCKYSNEGQPSIKAFFELKKIRVEEENIIVKKVACKGLYEENIKNMCLIVQQNLEDQLDLILPQKSYFQKL
jgi:hypothetical protein